MTHRFQPPDCALLVYTDLDGTLLDHDSYRFEAALPALRRLQQLRVPVVPVTSKTLAELEVLLPALDISGPCIAENGGLIAVPPGYLDGETVQRIGRFDVLRLSLEYNVITDILHTLRHESGFAFRGFADMDASEVAAHTGLDRLAAQRARQRLCSEPLLWEDSAAALEAFADQLRQRGCRLTQGGRFFHVSGQADKALAVRRLGGWFSRAGFRGFTTVALGDSPNDIPMLQSADIAVVVRRRDDGWLPLETHGRKVLTRAGGPAGWNEFFAENLDTLIAEGKRQRTHHG